MQTISLLVSIVIYTLYFTGLFLLGSRTVDALVRRFRLRRRLSAAYGKAPSRLDPALAKLLPFCGLVFLVSFALSLRYFRFLSAILLSAAAASLPVLVLLARRGAVRRRAGKEGLALVTELYRQYRIKDRNIYEAISAVLSASGDYHACRKPLSLLLARLRDAGSKAQVIRSCKKFSSGLGTLWGRMLAGCIEAAVIRGADVSEALSDIASQLGEAQKLAEERKRLNSEAIRMTVFLVPALYAGTMFIAARFLGLGIRDLLRNQFASPEGLMLLVLSAFLFLVDLVILQHIENTGTDC